MTFHIARGLADALQFYAPFVGHDPWSADRAHAHPFVSRASAEHVRASIHLVSGETLMVIPSDDGAGSGSQVQHHAGSMRQAMDAALLALHEAGALTRDSAAGVGEMLRCGPGPDRPAVHGL